MRKIKQNFSFSTSVIAFAVLMVFMTGCAGQEKAQEEENKVIVRRDLEEVLS